MRRIPAARRNRLILVTLALVGLAWVLWQTRGALVPFAVGGVIAYILAPFVALLERAFPQKGRMARLARPLAILFSYLFMLGVLFLAGFFLVPPLVDQTVELIQQVPDYWEDLQRQGGTLISLYEERVPEALRQRIEGNLDAVTSQLGAALQTAGMATFGAVSTIIGITAGLALLPLWMFYVLKDQREGMHWFYTRWPVAWRDDVRAIVGLIDQVLGAYIRGQLVLGIIIGVVTGLAMWVLGIRQSLVLGVLAGVFELIPILGPWLAFTVAALVTLATAPDRILWVGLAFLLIQQLENTFLVPKVQGDAVRIHPAIIMLLLVIGGSLWGLWGIVIIVPVAAILRDVFVYLYHRFDDGEIDDGLAGPS